MSVIFYPVYVVLGTLELGTRGKETYDWADLLSSPEKVGGDLPIPQQHGDEPRDRFRPGHRAVIGIRLYGEWDDEGDPVPGGRLEWMENVYNHLAEFRAVGREGTQVELSLVTPWHTYEAEVDAYINHGGTPVFLNPYTIQLAVGVVLPAGELDLAIPEPSP